MVNSIIDFIVKAKRSTYASQGDDASVSPAFVGSRQLEYREETLLYRDIYFGFFFFVGQEVVYENERPVWSMCYSGGVERFIISHDDAHAIYAFLRSALRQVSRDFPFRGPKMHNEGVFTYKNSYEGDFDSCSGQETIFRGNEVVYRLQFSGGMVR
ncbi:MAG: DUF5680 domain-containing protein [Alicyclobacillus sp.]|nr:DUF5680 domain-containing protein [Alicyclobacillus sp.]